MSDEVRNAIEQCMVPMKSLAVYYEEAQKEGRIPLFFRSRFKRMRPTAKQRWEPHTRKLQLQVLVGHHFGEFTVGVTLHEDVQYRIVCDQKYIEGKTKEKESAGGEVGLSL